MLLKQLPPKKTRRKRIGLQVSGIRLVIPAHARIPRYALLPFLKETPACAGVTRGARVCASPDPMHITRSIVMAKMFAPEKIL
jgi:hypothetical protein